MPEVTDARLSELRTKRESVYAQRGQILDGAVLAERGLTEEERRSQAALGEQLSALDERIADLVEAEKREAAAAAARVTTGVVPEQRSAPATSSASVRDPEVYARGNRERSYFRDLACANLFGDRDAAERLRRNTAQTLEARALGNTNTAGGSGGEFAPPEWLVQDWVKLARPGRVTCDLFHHSDVPAGISSVNLPKLLTGTAIAPQTTQNTTLASTDLTTGSVSTGFSTLGGTQLVSQQLLDQAEVDFDQVIKTDLAAVYAQTIATQVLLGTGTGTNNNAVINGLYSAAVPAGNTLAMGSTVDAKGFYSKASGLISAFVTNRYTQPTHWLMHPRRWYWLLAQVDANNRPLVVPEASSFNTMATASNPDGSAGRVGTFLGLPVVIDPLHPTNLGTGTNEDRVWLIKADDLWFFESPARAEVFREPYAASVGVLFRLYSYAGTILNRYPASLAYISGLTAPTF